MNPYIWQNKKPRLSLFLMNKHPRMGGLGLPNLQAYHFAVTLDQIKHWWHNATGKTWSDMEAKMMGVPYWKAVLLDPIPEPTSRSSMPPSVGITLHYWKALLTEGYMQSGSIQVSVPLNYIPLHILNFQIYSWFARGIATLGDLYYGSSI